jgi:hypothetical protein
MEDLSSRLPAQPLTASESMVQGGTISVAPPFTGPGSESEQPAGITAGTPGGSVPAVTGPSVIVSGGKVVADAPWTAAGGSAWREAADVTPLPAQAPRGADGRWRQA